MISSILQTFCDKICSEEVQNKSSQAARYTIWLLVLSLFSGHLGAQTLDYFYTGQTEVTWSELSGDVVLFSGTFDDEVTAAIPVVPITMGVQGHVAFFVSTNGFMTLSQAPPANTYDPLSTGLSSPVIAPFATNLEGIDASSEVSYRQDTQGLYIQWKNVRRVGYAGESFSFQVRIISQAMTGFGFGAINLIYGPFEGVSDPVTPVHVGIRVGSGTSPDTYSVRSVSQGGTWFPDQAGTASSATCAFPAGNYPEGVPVSGTLHQWFLISLDILNNPDVSPECNGNGNLVIYSNYDGGILNINCDVDIPDLRIGICTYEPVEITITGPFASNVTAVMYAGFNSTQANDNCNLGDFPTTISGVDPSITQILTAPPLNYETLHGNGQSGWGGAFNQGLMVGVSGQCDTLYPAGGGNTPDEVVYYFVTNLGDDLLFHHTQYNCWLGEVYNISDGGNCCINPVEPPWTIEVPADAGLCFGSSIQLALADNTNGEAPFTYVWTFNDDPVCNEESCTFVPAESGTVCVTVTDGSGEVLSDCFEVTVDPQAIPVFSVSDTALCRPASFTLINETDPATYAQASWTIGGVSYPNQQSVTFSPFNPGLYDVALVLTTALGCVYDTTLTDYLEVFPVPEAGYTTDPVIINADQTNITLQDQSLGDPVEWNWTIELPDGNWISTDQNPETTLPEGVGGTYPVELLVTNVDGCSDSISGLLEVNEVFNLYVPNAFTPNDDRVNDAFFVEAAGLEPGSFRMDIFNRWGESVYSSTYPDGAWTGSFQGGEYFVPDGVYTYRISMRSSETGELLEVVGNVTLMR
jgi:gliding motility-associated-like protein